MKHRAGASFFLLLMAPVLGAELLAVALDKHLSADGVFYLFELLQWQHFKIPDDSRQFADFVLQWPVLVAARSGVEDLAVLDMVFGLGLLLPWVLCVGLSFFALRGQHKSGLFFLVASLLLINLSSDYILAGEHQLMSLLCWPIAFLLLREQPLRPCEQVLLVFLAVLLTRSYPTAFAAAAVLIVLAGMRMKTRDSLPERATAVAVIACCLVAIVVSVGASLSPLDAGNRADFVEALGYIARQPVIGCGGLALVLFSAGWILDRRALWVSAVLPLLVLIPYLLMTGNVPNAQESFGIRSLTLPLLPALIAAAAWVQKRALPLHRGHAAVIALFVVTLLSSNLYTTWQWNEFRAGMREVLRTETGLVPIAETPMAGSPSAWNWNNSLLSIAWEESCVDTVVLNPPGQRWIPDAPPKATPISRYRCYDPVVMRATQP